MGVQNGSALRPVSRHPVGCDVPGAADVLLSDPCESIRPEQGGRPGVPCPTPTTPATLRAIADAAHVVNIRQDGELYVATAYPARPTR